MSILNYSLSSRQIPKYREQANEIKFQYKDHKAIPEFIEKYPQARIALVLPYSWNNEIDIDWTQIDIYSKLAKGNFILGITNGYELAQAKERNLNFYHCVPLHTFQELDDVVRAGVKEVILGAPLFFQLDKIKARYSDINIRALANVALPEGSLSYNNGVCGGIYRKSRFRNVNGCCSRIHSAS